MFWGKKSTKEGEIKEKLSGPREIPGPVQNYLIAEKKLDPDLVQLLRALVRKSVTGEKSFNIRIFDPSDALAKKKAVKDYTSLDESPDLIIYAGWFDEGSKQVKMEEKKVVNWDTTIFTPAEIQQKIEALREPGSSVFFYMARGVKHGGPLGMGAAVVQVNPNYPAKEQKKYIAYVVDVIDTQPVENGKVFYDSDKLKDIVRWISGGHRKRSNIYDRYD